MAQRQADEAAVGPAGEAIYKGATRPAVWAGVPLVPFIVASGLAAVLAMYGLNLFGFGSLIPIAFVYVPLIAWMRLITKKDDQRLRQMLLRMRLGLTVRTPVWGGARSYALVELRNPRGKGRR
jgi:type IV secretion system protein VirB3